MAKHKIRFVIILNNVLCRTREEKRERIQKNFSGKLKKMMIKRCDELLRLLHDVGELSLERDLV